MSEERERWAAGDDAADDVRGAPAAATGAGWAVLRTARDCAEDMLGPRLAGLYAVGSLTHGGFAEDVSDVDGVVMVDRCDAATAAAVVDIARLTVDTCGPGLAERLSLFYGDWRSFGDPPATARLPPIVRLDLIEHGVALHGDPPPASLPVPSRDDLLRESAAFAADRLDRPGELDLIHDPAALVGAGRRPLTKTVLFPVRFLATACAGLAGSNDEAVAWYTSDARPHAPLAAAALGWRTRPIDDQATASHLLATHLPNLYAEAIDAYKNLDAIPADVRARLRALRRRLRA
jgi:hypothetical protein